MNTKINNKTIVFDPYEGSKNKYVEIMIEIIESTGIQCQSISFAFSSFSRFKRIEYFHLNWFEDIRTVPEFGKKIIKLSLLVLFKKKIVWTMHNKASHEKKHRFLSLILRNILVGKSHKILVHNKISKEILVKEEACKDSSKIVYIPHPNYVNRYEGYTKVVEHTGVLRLLFIGAVRRYKNLEVLINCVGLFDKSEVILTIVGKPISSSYEAELVNLVSRQSNIKCNFEFVPDNKIIDVINEHDLLVLPYNTESTLNSGTVLLAFSQGRSVICPEIGTTLDISIPEIMFTYNYTNEESHAAELKNQIQKAIQLKKDNASLLSDYGTMALNEVAVFNSDERIANTLAHVYN